MENKSSFFKSFLFIILLFVLIFAGIKELKLRRISSFVAKEYDQKIPNSIHFLSPLNGSVYPADMSSPKIEWKDSAHAPEWVVCFEFSDKAENFHQIIREPEFVPDLKTWEKIKAKTKELPVVLRILGLRGKLWQEVVSAGKVQFQTSRDSVIFPILYREVNLPFGEAVKDPTKIRWRWGMVSQEARPVVVLENLPVCGNCHSFSKDGKILGMDVDYANDKGSYAIAEVKEEISLNPEKIITWSDYKREDLVLTYGLLSQVSPDGENVVSTVKDRSVFVAKPDLEFSQLFFPVRGILAVYNRKAKTFRELSGADNRKYVQSNAVWSPDGNTIVFTRAEAYQLKTDVEGKVLLSPEECKEFLKEGKTFKFDLYKVPFNNGKGGSAVAIKGASQNGMSNYFARYTPDGKWIIFCKAASFSLLQPDSRLYRIPSEGGEAKELECNLGRMNSWHSISPNGKWMVFSSKANTPYTQLFLTHLDSLGQTSIPVLLWRFTNEDRAANIPEFAALSWESLKKIKEQFVDDLSYVRAAEEYLRVEDLTGAITAYKKALAINPHSASTHNKIAIIYGRMGNFDQAIFHHTEALKYNPDDSDTHYNLGLAFSLKNRDKEAIEHFNMAIALNPKDDRAHVNLGIILKKHGKIKEALEHYELALRANPKNAKAHSNMGVIFSLQGKGEEAIQHFNEAIKLDPKEEIAHSNLAAALFMLGKLDEAAIHFQEAIKLEPNDYNLHLRLGNILEKQQKWEEAAASYTQALRIRPDLAVAKAGLERIKKK